ncbi:sigma-54-dependent transcriptional regulator [Dyadobacter fermentans]|uniref:Two component, sigma54 specific, transcriptional regulator, Fis family n=1 Tax=Dyadobacter fermentans (strain ATCC 700827 / DSM 18053 / CIP 107007 / KCTC 52180 / NS114) TaxID=471854 RepID=C6W5U8_DYAFD|nr:sigma-54 dependent transcriptional regulator [Dyadobacter fermentans]ACT96037.1 two component, sigma54 specific, transcriptional regulator, Fis family [Dyadobacter fermentans DSM 18053]
MLLSEAKILIIDDDVDVLSAAKLLLKRHAKAVDIEKNPQKLPFLVTNGDYNLILLDMNFTRDVNSGREGFHWLDRILDINPAAKVIMITAYGDIEMAIRAIKAGAIDFVLKPWENDKLLATIATALEGGKDKVAPVAEEKTKDDPKKNSKAAADTIVATSDSMRQVLLTAERVASTDANVLILGENGTGKTQLARHVHQHSKRADKPFVAVDLGAISETLFESELFGHVKGAFTDAKEDRAGRFEEAKGGTIFLDEIGNLTLPLQAKLLTVIQERKVTRVGSNKPIALDVRLICATNMNIEKMVTDKTFRQDLLYRINTIELELPPLRDRPEDISALADYYLKQYAKKYNRPVNDISNALVKKMQQYNWPGNIRELQHAVERAVILSQEKTLQPDDLFLKSSAGQPATATGFDLEDMEKTMIIKALKRFNGNITDAARELGLSRAALYRRMEKYGL